MIHFFSSRSQTLYALESKGQFNHQSINKLKWLLGGASYIDKDFLEGTFIGPRKEMITPWSTNAVEITQNMGINGVIRIEEYFSSPDENPKFDPMLQAVYHNLDQKIFHIDKKPDPIIYIEDIGQFNQAEGLALSED